MLNTLARAIFPPVHRHPKKHPHEWSPLTSQQLDPFRPLEPGEDGCGPAIHTFILDYDVDGHCYSYGNGVFVGVPVQAPKEMN